MCFGWGEEGGWEGGGKGGRGGEEGVLNGLWGGGRWVLGPVCRVCGRLMRCVKRLNGVEGVETVWHRVLWVGGGRGCREVVRLTILEA